MNKEDENSGEKWEIGSRYFLHHDQQKGRKLDMEIKNVKVWQKKDE